MNTKPDDTTLALWLEDELHGEDLAHVEAWAIDHPEQLDARNEIRRWRKMIAAEFSATEEPPAAEFFNERIIHSIRLGQQKKTTHVVSWYRWLTPLAACAGMVLAFLLGMTIHKDTPTPQVNHAPKPPSALPIIYTPEQGVNAEWFTSTDASATVIILNGVDSIPDDVDFSNTASINNSREIDSTASTETPTLIDP
jgi:hypothetical protein